MKKKHIYISDFFAKSETNYQKSMQSFISFICEFLHELSQADLHPHEKKSAEQMIIMSLVLLEKIHMHLFYLKFLCQNAAVGPKKKHLFHKKERSAYQSLKELKHIIIHYHFHKKEYEKQAERIVSQMLDYYH